MTKKEDDKIVADLDAQLAKDLESNDAEAAQKAADKVEKAMNVTPTPPAAPPKPRRGEDGFVREAGPDSAQD